MNFPPKRLNKILYDCFMHEKKILYLLVVIIQLTDGIIILFLVLVIKIYEIIKPCTIKQESRSSKYSNN